jgi:lipopolysaccharide transport system permease protein
MGRFGRAIRELESDARFGTVHTVRRITAVGKVGQFVVRRLWSHRDLVLSLVRRQYQLRYRQSAAGLGWAIIPPIATLGMGILVFHGVARIKTSGASYPVFALSGLAPWSFFSASLMFGIPSIVQTQPMVARFPFPKAALPLSLIGLSFLDLSVSMVLFVGVVLVGGDGLSWTALWFPVLLVIEVAFAAGLVMFFSALDMFARDIKLAVPLVVQMWLFLTPVMYPLESVPPSLRLLYIANPMTGLIENFHRVLAYGLPPDFGLLVPSVLGALAANVIGWWYFGATESRFADVI